MKQIGLFPLARVKVTRGPPISANGSDAIEEAMKCRVHQLCGTSPDELCLIKLGGGCYAKVYAHPTDPDKVVKVASNSVNYVRYLLWALRHQDNPYVPRIYHVEVFKNLDTSGYGARTLALVIMEKLTVTDDPGEEVRSVLRCFRGDETGPDLLEQTKQYLRSKFSYLDMHYQNVLLRIQGDIRQPVITDPVAG